MVAVPLPSIGDVVAGKYRIDAKIGEGGMGVVLGAMDTSLGRPVAIKFLTPARALNEAAATRFGREARAAASIQSEHVVRVYEVGALPSGAPFIVMEHLKGSDLAQVVDARGGLPIDESADFVLQACEALGEAHARGIVHRDLKPQNLFLTTRNDGSPCVKVLDFGISKSAEADESSPKLTSTDMVMGTPLYMSPEQVRSLKSVDARADVWALGAILHELLTASPPFDGPTASALHAAIAMDPPTPLRTRRPDAPAELEAVIARCLEKKPADRFQDVGALAAALAPFATERGRTSASRIGNVVRKATTSDPAITPPPGDAATISLGVASTMSALPLVTPAGSGPALDSASVSGSASGSAPRAATDGAWEQKPVTAVPPPSAPPRIRAGAIAAAILLVGGALVGAYALGSRKNPAPQQASPAPVAMPPPPATSVEAVAMVAPSASTSAVEPVLEEARPPTARAHPPTRRPAATVSTEPPKSAPLEPFDKDRAADRGAAERPEHFAILEGECRRAQEELHRFADPLTRKANAEHIRQAHCKGMASIPCQVEVCLAACGTLNDQVCLADPAYHRLRPPTPNK